MSVALQNISYFNPHVVVSVAISIVLIETDSTTGGLNNPTVWV